MPQSVSARTYRAIALIAASLVISHIWLLFERNSAKIRPFPLLKEYELSLRWYLCFAGSSIAYVLVAGAFLIVSRMNQLLKVAAIVFFIYSIIDLILFLLCNNTVSYTLVFGLLLLTIVVVSYFTFNNKLIVSKNLPSVRREKLKVEHLTKKYPQ